MAKVDSLSKVTFEIFKNFYSYKPYRFQQAILLKPKNLVCPVKQIVYMLYTRNLNSDKGFVANTFGL